MMLVIPLKGRGAAGAFIVGILAIGALLGRLVLFNFIVFSLSDSRSPVSTGALDSAAGYFPSSARLNARLAESRISDPDRDLGLAAQEIERAAFLSPHDYRLQVVLASIKESQRDLTAAEKAMREAASLAPSNIDVRWRLANLLLRESKITDSLVEFRSAVAGDQSLMPATLDLVWRVTGGDLANLQSVAPDTPAASLSVATFLLKHAQMAEAVRLFEGIDPQARRAAPASSDFINTMIKSGELEQARLLWIGLVSGSGAAVVGPQAKPIVWNGGFESDPITGLAQFDWNLGESEYATIGIDTGSAHQGSRSLRIDFAGRETTRLDGEIKQGLVLSPGRRYKLEFYVKTQNLVTTDGPRLALRCDGEPGWMSAGTAIAAGTGDWRKMELDFVVPRKFGTTGPPGNPLINGGINTLHKGTGQAPARGEAARSVWQTDGDAVAVTIKLIRIPKFSYDEPTRGTIWLDDFNIVEVD